MAYLSGRGAPSYQRLGAARILSLAIYEYHRRHGSVDAAIDYAGETFRRNNFKQQKLLDSIIDRLEMYDNSFQALGNKVASVAVRVGMDVGELHLTGEIGRVDLAEYGYAAWVFQKEHVAWSDELRMPLIQSHFAERFGVPSSEVSVGVYCFATGQHDCTTYPSAAIQQAIVETMGLGATLSA